MSASLSETSCMESIVSLYGDTYDFSSFVFTDANTPSTVICPDHGEFLATPLELISGNAECPTCGIRWGGMTTKRFVLKAKEVHGPRYDYTQTRIRRIDPKESQVVIACLAHGKYSVEAHKHLNGDGCPICRKLGDNIPVVGRGDMFKLKAAQVHGNKYDYSKVKFVDHRTPVEVVCPIHGGWFVSPLNHLGSLGYATGCPKCAVAARTHTLDMFIAEACKVHGNKYDYSKSVYVGRKTQLIVTCPEHGDFQIQPSNHTQGRGCPKCAIENARANRKGMANLSFEEKARLVHGDKYDYSKSVYTGRHSKLTIICPVHGEFEQDAGNHLRGSGCPKCQKEKLISYTKEEFIAKSKKVHGNNAFVYHEDMYPNKIKVTDILTFTCGVHNETFTQLSDEHIKGRLGCPACRMERGTGSFTRDSYIAIARNRPVTLYVIHVIPLDARQKAFYKVGITLYGVKKRFTGISKIATIVELVTHIFTDAGKAWDWELKAKQAWRNNQIKINYTEFSKFGGLSEEIFSEIDLSIFKELLIN